MKILRIELFEVIHRPLLNGLKLEFLDPDADDKILPNILIGINGSGKSQLLETISEIFLYLDRLYRKINKVPVSGISVLFELTYLIFYKNKNVLVKVSQKSSTVKEPQIEVVDMEGNSISIPKINIIDLLPYKVIGYTSGDNETLSLPFTDYYDEYAKYTGDRALGEKSTMPDYEPRFYLMDYNTNIGVLISNLILGDETEVKNLICKVGIDSLKSFQLVIQTKHSAAPTGKGVQLTNEHNKWIERLKNSATCYEYFEKEKKYVLDFFVTKETRKALTHFFKTPIDFYTALYKIELLNNLIVKDAYLREIKKQRNLRKLIIKPPTVPEQDKVLSYSEVKLKLTSGDIVNYINLSDGEHQYLNIFGTILMTDFANCIYLLDEPETHFNPNWRREFISSLTKIANGRKQDFFITSHSPFIVADSTREQVFIFKRTEKNSLNITIPTEETYGSDTDFILKVAFDLNTSLAKNSYDEITALTKSNDAVLIEEKINEFGDSAEKLFLFKRLEELKPKKK